MCLGIPMRIRNIQGDFAQVESGRLICTINIQMLPAIKVGDFVIVHAGFAIEKVNPQKAKETLEMLE